MAICMVNEDGTMTSIITLQKKMNIIRASSVCQNARKDYLCWASMPYGIRTDICSDTADNHRCILYTLNELRLIFYHEIINFLTQQTFCNFMEDFEPISIYLFIICSIGILYPRIIKPRRIRRARNIARMGRR
jgi:hypothetical protein